MEALASSRLGMAQALARFDRAGAAVVRATSAPSTAKDVEPIKAIADMVEAKHQFRASVQTARVADEMLRELLELQEED